MSKLLPEHIFIEAALSQVGQPYIWGGKGDKLWTPNGLVGNPFATPGELKPFHIFDCSGLVTWAWLQATGKDQRGNWTASVMFSGLPTPGDLSHVHLRLYGRDPKNVSHVAICLGLVEGLPFVIEAAGGDHMVTTVLEARNRGACVRAGFERRGDLQGVRSIPL